MNQAFSVLWSPHFQVSAADKDKGQNTRIEYEIQGDVVDEKFQIDKDTGIIQLLYPLDRDYPDGRPVWQFNVLAHDNDGSGNTLDGYAEVIVHLIDINDNEPIFSRVKILIFFTYSLITAELC